MKEEIFPFAIPINGVYRTPRPRLHELPVCATFHVATNAKQFATIVRDLDHHV